MAKHIAVFHKEFLELILSGEKTVDSRFSKLKSLPFGRIKQGDEILMKESGGPIRGITYAKQVKFFDNLTPSKIKQIFEKNPKIKATEEFFEAKKNSNYATLIFLENTKAVTPYKIEKKDRRAWISIDSTQRS
ncbi:MAG: hypothetical protein GOV01_02300 [Candidatus Altiarchaeota archaeon]|nr:hypothetical protein [Candidatus Altiarchaeota archaeon]